MLTLTFALIKCLDILDTYKLYVLHSNLGGKTVTNDSQDSVIQMYTMNCFVFYGVWFLRNGQLIKYIFIAIFEFLRSVSSLSRKKVKIVFCWHLTKQETILSLQLVA